MIKNAIVRKGLIVGIVLLFLTTGFSPIINADGNTIPQAIDDVPTIIFECKADGTVKRTVVRMSPEQADIFHEEMRNAQDLDTRLSIYKEYNLISPDITVDSLRAGMEERARSMGLTQDSLMSQFRINRSLFGIFVHRNIFCSVYGKTIGYAPIAIPFFRLLFLDINEIPSFDTADFIFGCLPLHSKGLLGEFRCYSYFLKMVGFVGIMYYFFIKDFGFKLDGFCVYAKAIGENI
jgi:hypothetical protein